MSMNLHETEMYDLQLEDRAYHGDKVRKNILDMIVSYIQEHQYPPTIQEIGDAVGLKSKSTVHSHLMKLIDEGKLETDRNRNSSISRAIRVPGYKFVKIDK